MQTIVGRFGSQGKFARVAGLKQQDIARYLKGSEPTRPYLIDIAKAANCSISWLATGEEERPQQSTQTATADRRGQAVVADGCFNVHVNQGDGGNKIEVSERERKLIDGLRRYASEAMWQHIEAMVADEAERYR